MFPVAGRASQFTGANVSRNCYLENRRHCNALIAPSKYENSQKLQQQQDLAGLQAKKEEERRDGTEDSGTSNRT
jgi:hypothetical protein